MDDTQEHAAGTFSVRLLAANREHVAVFSVRGEIDLATAPVLREVLRPVLEHQTGRVVVDLSEVPFMDSAGVHVLADTLRRLERQNRSLTIECHEDGQVHRLLAFVGLLNALTVYHSPSDVRALTPSLLWATQTTRIPASGAPGTGYRATRSVGGASDDVPDALSARRTHLATAVH